MFFADGQIGLPQENTILPKLPERSKCVTPLVWSNGGCDKYIKYKYIYILFFSFIQIKVCKCIISITWINCWIDKWLFCRRLPTVNKVCSICIGTAGLTPEHLPMELQELENFFYVMVSMLYNYACKHYNSKGVNPWFRSKIWNFLNFFFMQNKVQYNLY